MAINPFSFGNPIKDPAHFYNRKNEIRQIVSRLLSAAHESTSVVGERRIGKTSLLKHLSNPEVAANYGLTNDHYCLIYIDFQGLTDITPRRFWQRVFKFMERDICNESLLPPIRTFSKQDEFDLFDLEDLFGMIKDSGLNIILFMDEFEFITQNPRFGPDFFGGLRSLAIHFSLALVTSTQHALVDLCHSDEVKSSPFFNIFATVALRPFSREDSYNLIEGYLRRTDLAFTPEEKEFVVSLGGGHPFFLQMGGFYLFDEKIQGYSSKALFEHVIQDFDQQADSHFHYLWNNCSESEKITLLTIITYNAQKPSQKTIPNLANLVKTYAQTKLDIPELIMRGLILEKEGVYTLFSTSLDKWIVHEVMASPGKEETQASVEEWLETSGPENLKAMKGTLPKFKKKYWPIVATILKDISLDFIKVGLHEVLVNVVF